MTTGKIFSGYFLFKKLSEEPFGETFRAGRLLGNVVDRIVLLQLFNGPEIEIESFWKLVRNRGPLHQAVSDPHIADGVEFGISDGVPFAAYEYRPGKTLWQFLNEAQSQSFPVPTDQALFVVERIALALTAAYGTQLLGRPVVHGFLVPELVRLSDEGHVHLTGFASAPGLRSQLAGKSSYRSYLAPEVRSWTLPSKPTTSSLSVPSSSNCSPPSVCQRNRKPTGPPLSMPRCCPPESRSPKKSGSCCFTPLPHESTAYLPPLPGSGFSAS
jgi:hypothetical protein